MTSTGISSSYYNCDSHSIKDYVPCYMQELLWNMSNDEWGSLIKYMFCSGNGVLIIDIVQLIYCVQSLVKKRIPHCSVNMVSPKST